MGRRGSYFERREKEIAFIHRQFLHFRPPTAHHDKAIVSAKPLCRWGGVYFLPVNVICHRLENMTPTNHPSKPPTLLSLHAVDADFAKLGTDDAISSGEVDVPLSCQRYSRPRQNVLIIKSRDQLYNLFLPNLHKKTNTKLDTDQQNFTFSGESHHQIFLYNFLVLLLLIQYLKEEENNTKPTRERFHNRHTAEIRIF